MSGRARAVDDQSEIIFRSLERRCRGNQFLLVLSTEMLFGDLRQMALAYGKTYSGAAGRANVGFCHASRFR